VLSRAEAGHEIQLTYSSFSLTQLIREVATTLQATLKARNTLEVITPEPDALQVHSDRTRIQQVAFNLVRNADKFTDGGENRLQVAASGPDQITITVADEGIGIAPDDLERIFTPFFQSDTQVGGSAASGVGLGLWLSQHIAAALGGSIRATSTPGVGSTFRFTFPAGQALATAPQLPADLPEPPATPPATAPRPPDQAFRILLADDNRLVRRPLVAILRRQDWIVDEADDGGTAEGCIRNPEVSYDAIVLDHRMPAPQGLDLLQKCRQEWKIRTPIVILTVDERSDLRERIEALDGQLLIKPIFPKKLLALLKQLVPVDI